MATIEQRVTALEADRELRNLRDSQLATEVRQQLAEGQRANAKMIESVNTNINALRSTMGDMKGKTVAGEFTALRSDFAGLRGEFTGLRDTIGDMQGKTVAGEFAALRSDITTLNTTMGDMGGKTVAGEFAAIRSTIGDMKGQTVADVLTKIAEKLGVD